MKLLNYTTTYLAAILLVIIGFWAFLFYDRMVYIFYDEINEGLVNQKHLILKKAQTDSSILKHHTLAEGNFNIKEVDFAVAQKFEDVFVDTVLYMPLEKEDEPIRILKTVFEKNNHFYQLNIASSTVGQDDIVKELVHNLLLLYVCLVGSILLINNFLLKKAWRPFYQLLGELENYTLENPKALTVSSTTIKEFNMLNNSVQKMLTHNAEIYNSQKQFIENASHELQTPVAITLNKLETLLNVDGLSEEGLKLLGGAISNLQRLTRLNKSLLLLSKIDNYQFKETKFLNLNEMVEKSVADFGDQLEFSNISLSINNVENCNLKVSPDLALILVNNLIKNSIVHNVYGGSITIEITSKFLRVENTGKSGALNKDKLFLRFYKEGHSSQSTGLGLAIVKAITDIYNFSTDYAYNNKHIITINFSS